jgi:hypothetical protein
MWSGSAPCARKQETLAAVTPKFEPSGRRQEHNAVYFEFLQILYVLVTFPHLAGSSVSVVRVGEHTEDRSQRS